jgi:hypothetical protein
MLLDVADVGGKKNLSESDARGFAKPPGSAHGKQN